MPDITAQFAISYAIVIFFGIGLHEYAHCKFADMAGDPTPRSYGRVTLNLFKHFEPTGTIMIALSAATGLGIGWGRPAPINPAKMRNPRWDAFVAVLAGPVSNLLQATVWALIFRIQASQGSIAEFSSLQDAPIAFIGVLANLGMAVFNMTPIGPLDGHWIVGLLLPDRLRDKWFWWQRRYGFMVLIGLIILGDTLGRTDRRFDFFGSYVFPAVEFLMRILLGRAF